MSIQFANVTKQIKTKYICCNKLITKQIVCFFIVYFLYIYS